MWNGSLQPNRMQRVAAGSAAPWNAWENIGKIRAIYNKQVQPTAVACPFAIVPFLLNIQPIGVTVVSVFRSLQYLPGAGKQGRYTFLLSRAPIYLFRRK